MRILAPINTLGAVTMRPLGWGLLFAALCLPLAFVIFLTQAARHPALDSVTLSLPDSLRTTIADLALRNAGYGKEAPRAIDRILRIDPNNPDAWQRRCAAYSDDGVLIGEVAPCKRALALNSSAVNFNNFGLAQQKAKDFCAAEDSFTSAMHRSQNSPYYIRNMSSAAIRCGHPEAATAGFEVVETLDAKSAAESTNNKDDLDKSKADLLADREYLTVSYLRIHQPQKSANACTRAHPEWTTESCHCELTDTTVKCTGAPASAAPAR